VVSGAAQLVSNWSVERSAMPKVPYTVAVMYRATDVSHIQFSSLYA